MANDIFAVRGAIAPVANTRDGVYAATRELLSTILARNGLRPNSIVFAFFTVTQDLNAAFPATAARAMGRGWESVPMMCGLEVAVPGALQHCIRVLLLCSAARQAACPRLRRRSGRGTARSGAGGRCARKRGARRRGPVHVYLGEAAVLRPDLAGPAGQRDHQGQAIHE